MKPQTIEELPNDYEYGYQQGIADSIVAIEKIKQRKWGNDEEGLVSTLHIIDALKQLQQSEGEQK